MKRLFYLLCFGVLFIVVLNIHFPTSATSFSTSTPQWSSLGSYATTLPAGISLDTPYVQEAWSDAEAANIPPGYFVRQIKQESGFNPSAVGGVGELGIAQFTLGTAQEVGLKNRLDPSASLQAAAGLMSRYFSHYKNYDQALAAYNAGAPTVDGARNRGGKHWYWYIPQTTIAYILAITGQQEVA